MDFLTKHWEVFPRSYPTRFTLGSLGYLPAKDQWVRRTFSTFNFSFILKGRGEFHQQGKTWLVEAPCVLTQTPGQFVEYGPPESTSWDELYLIYAADCVPTFKACGIVLNERPVWRIASIRNVMSQIRQLSDLANSPTPHQMADRMDRVCERMIVESLLPNEDPSLEFADNAIRSMFETFHESPGKPHNFSQLAKQHGMSESTLRRRWLSVFNMPISRYLLNLRIQKARRLLVETFDSVGEIARNTGFEDPLYFSRRFGLETGLSPLAYRKQYQLR